MRVWSGKTTWFSCSRYALARHCICYFPCQTSTRSFFRFSLPAFFLPGVPRLQAASPREILHVQDQCGNQMGRQFWEVVCDEQDVGFGGEYYGDNDAQLGRIGVFLAPHTNGPRDVPRCGALSSLYKSPPPPKGDSAEFSPGLKQNLCDLVTACQPSPLEQLSLSGTAIGPLRMLVQ
jgi:hypothetical protein